MKYWSIKSRNDGLPLYAWSASPEGALKVAEELVGPIAPAGRSIIELSECPEGYVNLNIESPHLLAELEDV